MPRIIKTKWLIDSNIIIHWIMGKYIGKWLIIEHFNLSEDLLKTYQKRYKHSFSFIESIPKWKRDNNFYVTTLNLNEVFSGVKEEVKSVLLFVKGYPISRWGDKRLMGQIQIEEEFIREIRDLIFKSFDDLFKKTILLQTADPSNYENYFDVYSSITLLNVAYKTQDAILLTTAIFEGMNYFVTCDDGLIESTKPIQDGYNFKVIKPNQAIKILEGKNDS